jgi:hypothetical protein
MLLASNEINYTFALRNFYKRLTPWEKNFKYISKKKFIESHLQNAQYINIDFKPNIVSKKILQDFSRNGLIVYVVVNSGVQFDLPHTLENIIIMPLRFLKESEGFLLHESAKNELKESENERIKNEIIAHELFHIYFRYFRLQTLVSFRSMRSIVKIDRNTFVGEITNPDTEDFEGLKIGNKIIFKVLLDGGAKYIEKSFTAVFLNGWNVRPSNLYEKNLYEQLLPFNQNYHSEEMVAELCC